MSPAARGSSSCPLFNEKMRQTSLSDFWRKSYEHDSEHDHRDRPRQLRPLYQRIQEGALGNRERCDSRAQLRSQQEVPAGRALARRGAAILDPHRTAFHEPDSGPHLRQHVRAGGTLHLRQSDGGFSGSRPGGSGRSGSPGALQRRGAEAPGVVPASGDHGRGQDAGQLRVCTRIRTRLPKPCSASRAGPSWD